MAGNTEEKPKKTLFYIPEEITVDILLRLPAESLCQCKCVSKHWKNLISDPDFIEMHLNRQNNPTTKLILSSGSLYTADHFICAARRLDFEKTAESKSYGLLGSCNGLLLLEKNFGSVDHCLLLVNPTTSEFNKLPDSPFVLKNKPKRCEVESIYGFGYAASEDDYKVVKIYSYGLCEWFRQNIVSVYSLKSNSWNRVRNSPYGHSVRGAFPGVFCNGAIHWLVMGLVECLPYSYNKGMIASFDLENEKFNDFSIPGFVDSDEEDSDEERESVCAFVDVGKEDLRSCELGVMRGHLYVFISRYDGSYLDVYRMNECCVKESWTKEFTIAITHLYALVPLDFINNRVLVMSTDKGKLINYNAIDHTYEYLAIEGHPTKVNNAMTYVETLVRPKSGGEIGRQHQESRKKRKREENEEAS